MKKVHVFTKIVVGSAIALGATTLLAETVNTTASVTVQNAFNLTQVNPLSIGTIRAVADPAGTNQSTILIPADGSAPSTTTAANTSAAILVAGSPATYTVDGAAPFSSLTLTLPAGPVNVTASAAPPGTPKFTLGTFAGYITSGPNSGTAYAAANLQTNATGEVSFSVGATLSTDSAVTTLPYIDGAYSGTFPVIVVY